jgi:carboxypeptidase Taq
LVEAEVIIVSYEALEARHRRLSHLGHVEAIVGWDEAAMMPPGGGESRAEALATLRVLVHEMATDPALGELFAAAEAQATSGTLSPWQVANLREMKRTWTREVCIPAELVAASSRAESRCEQAWRGLRPKSDWTTFAPLLSEVVARKREVAAALSAKLGLGVYDALLDGYEPGGRAAAITPVFDHLRRALPPLIQEIAEVQARSPVVMPAGPFPVERQRWLGVELMKRVGFDFQHGRLDVSHHPFCGGVPRDVRITTRYDEADFTKSLMGVLHETGHAKYEQNLPAEWLDQPVGRARSMALHESQSLLQEMQVSRARPFLDLAAPLVREAFPDAVGRQPEAFSTENLYRVYTRVMPGYIRVDADEATYPCHVILRFDLEQRLVEGRMQVKDLPEAWDAGMRALLGLSTGDNHRDGCMQDVHWPAGLFGYFPTYTLGALAAAQIFAAARAALPTIDAQIAAGDFAPLNAWLRERIWSRGCLLDTPDLVTQATGAPLGAAAFERHLRARYLA